MDNVTQLDSHPRYQWRGAVARKRGLSSPCSRCQGEVLPTDTCWTSQQGLVFCTTECFAQFLGVKP